MRTSVDRGLCERLLGSVLFLSDWDWAGAERSLRRALEVNPDYTEALLQYGSLQEALGRLDEGLRLKHP